MEVMRHTLMVLQHYRLVQDPLRLRLLKGLPHLRPAMSHLLLAEALHLLVEVSRLLLVEVLSRLLLVEVLSHQFLVEVLSRQALVEVLSRLFLVEVLSRPRLAEALLSLAEVLLRPWGDPFLQVLVAGPFQRLAAHLLGWPLVHAMYH